jgi:hypothetical protein
LLRAIVAAALSASIDSLDPSTPTTIPPGVLGSYSHAWWQSLEVAGVDVMFASS